MGNKNKNKNNSFSSQEKSQEYDLAQSLNKVRPFSRHTKKNNAGDGTHSDDEKQAQARRGSISSNSSLYNERTTGTPSWDRYDRLEDRLTSFSDKNEREHTALRQELEGKIERLSDDFKDRLKDLKVSIDKKLPLLWYKLTIAALGFIVSIIWIFSYQEIAQIPKEMIRIDNRINNIEIEIKKDSVYNDTATKSKGHIENRSIE